MSLDPNNPPAFGTDEYMAYIRALREIDRIEAQNREDELQAMERDDLIALIKRQQTTIITLTVVRRQLERWLKTIHGKVNHVDSEGDFSCRVCDGEAYTGLLGLAHRHVHDCAWDCSVRYINDPRINKDSDS